MEANNERIGLTGSTPEISFASSSSLPLFHIFICSSTWTAGIGRNNVLTNSPPRLGCSFTHLFAGRSRAHKMKNHSSPIESTYRDNLAPAILPLSASQSTGHLNRLGGRENQKYEHLDKTKDLRKGGRTRKGEKGDGRNNPHCSELQDRVESAWPRQPSGDVAA
jgi:hypothetical protein